MLAKRRRAEAMESGRRLGVTYEVLDDHDGELLPTLQSAPADHPLHPPVERRHRAFPEAQRLSSGSSLHGSARARCRLHGRRTQRLPDTPPLHDNPVFLYFEDHFQRPNPFRPDVSISIDSVFEKKVDALDSHVSQVYEWLPWVDHTLDQVPKGVAERKKWLASQREGRMTPEIRKTLEKWYGAEKAAGVRNAESFELCEYGRRPTDDELRDLFPMLGK